MTLTWGSFPFLQSAGNNTTSITNIWLIHWQHQHWLNPASWLAPSSRCFQPDGADYKANRSIKEDKKKNWWVELGGGTGRLRRSACFSQWSVTRSRRVGGGGGGGGSPFIMPTELPEQIYDATRPHGAAAAGKRKGNAALQQRTRCGNAGRKRPDLIFRKWRSSPYTQRSSVPAANRDDAILCNKVLGGS